MTSRRSTACFVRSAKTLGIGAAVAAIAFAARGERSVRACVGGDPRIQMQTTFDPRVIDEPKLSDGVYYEAWLSGFGGFTADSDADQLVADWHGYLSDTGVSDADWHGVLYGAPDAELDALRRHLAGKGPIPHGYDKSSLWSKPAAAGKLDAALELVRVIRDIEPSTTISTDTTGQQHQPLPTAKLLAAANAGATAHAADPFLAQRFAFQAVRALFYQRDFSGVVAYVDSHAQVLAQPSNALKWRGRYYLAGALRQVKDIARQSYELARIHAEYPPLAGAAATDFKPVDDADWHRSIDLARTVREKTELWRLVGLRFDGLTAIKEIEKLDPKSDLLAVLVVRELAKAESAAGSIMPDMTPDADMLAKARKAEQALEAVVVELSSRPGVDRKWVLDLAGAHLAALRGDVGTTRTRIAAALAGRPNDARAAGQAKASLALALARSWTIDGSHENELGRAMWAIGSDNDRAETVESDVRNLLAPAYLKAGRLVDAEYLKPGIVDGTSEDSHREPRPGKLHWAQVNFIKEMIARTGRAGTDFDRFVLHQPAFTKPALEQELALRYVLDDDFQTADQVFASSDALSQRLHTDPFVIHIRDCHDCDHDKYANATWTHASFVRKLVELAAKARSAKANASDDAAADAAMQVGIGLYNMSWFGNARTILGEDTHQNTHDTRVALKWFGRAFDLANNRELKAKIAYDAAKAELGDRLDVADDPNRKDAPSFTPITWYGKLKTLKDTQYYAEVLQECGYFADWVASTKH